MVRKKSENLLTIGIFQKTNNIIGFTIKAKNWLGEDKITGIEHSDQYHGNDMSRTHDNLFGILKSILAAQGRWIDKETKVGKKKDKQYSELDPNKRYGYIYMTTNKKNGMRYIGKHTHFGDDYLGSGKKFKQAVKEFGKENFEQEILAFGYSKEHLNSLEKNYINQFNATKDPGFYNEAPGGDGWYEKKDEEVCN